MNFPFLPQPCSDEDAILSHCHIGRISFKIKLDKLMNLHSEDAWRPKKRGTEATTPDAKAKTSEKGTKPCLMQVRRYQ